jgi:hypothetical protein
MYDLSSVTTNKNVANHENKAYMLEKTDEFIDWVNSSSKLRDKK